MQRPKNMSGGAVGGKPNIGSLLSGSPLVWELLTDDQWDDGEKRERASILLVCDGPQVKLWLNDRATNRTAWVSGDTLEQALATLEEQLEVGSVSWRTVDGKRRKS